MAMEILIRWPSSRGDDVGTVDEITLNLHSNIGPNLRHVRLTCLLTLSLNLLRTGGSFSPLSYNNTDPIDHFTE